MKLPGINIQYPWSELLLSGAKTIETRTYALPKKYIGIELAIIETPGLTKESRASRKSRIAGTITFGLPFKYSEAKWKSDVKKHLVPVNDPAFSWRARKKEIWGWPVIQVRRINPPLPAPVTRGIVFARVCKI
jgi:hypothetical protein